MRGTSRAREVGKMATQTDLDQSTVDGIPAGILGIPPPTLHRRGEVMQNLLGAKADPEAECRQKLRHFLKLRDTGSEQRPMPFDHCPCGLISRNLVCRAGGCFSFARFAWPAKVMT
mmetsp:Transcript_28978/g.68273  ORF Transcript_28978/g.68273 Transcript_28978/m.68273 type:complete len:116 (+) Transcript_28978:2443-2790(+)